MTFFETTLCLFAAIGTLLVFTSQIKPVEPKCVSVELINGRILRIDDVKQEGKYLLSSDRKLNVPLSAVAVVTGVPCD